MYPVFKIVHVTNPTLSNFVLIPQIRFQVQSNLIDEKHMIKKNSLKVD